MAELNYDTMETEIMDQIEQVRAEYAACTARLVASRMNVSKEVVRYRLQTLRDQGLVDWNDVPGSLRLTTANERKAFESADQT